MLVSLAWLGPAIFATFNRIAQTRLNGWDAPSLQELIFEGGDWFLYAFLVPGIFAVSARWPLVRPHLARRVPLHLGFALAFSAAWAILGKIFQGVLALFLTPNAWQRATADLSRFEAFAVRDVTGWIFITLPYGVALYLAMVGVEHAIRYFVEMREQQVRVARLSEQLADARLAALQAQLNPHFLFNALNTIAVHAREGDGAATARIVERLSDVLRRTLGRHRAGEVPLDEELELVRQYVEIEQARFPDRLTVTYEVADDTRRASVPGFVLQHLVENAIRHGVSRRSERGTVRVSARRDAQSLLLTVDDDGPGLSPAFEFPEGHGLANTRERLRTLHGDGDWLDVRPGAGGGTTARVRIPFREATSEEAHATP